MLLASSLVHSNLRHDVAPRKNFEPIFNRVYGLTYSASPSEERIHLQQLALVYAILALGTHHNLEIPPNDATSNEFGNLAKACLSSDDFLNHNTIAGVQALVSDGARSHASSVLTPGHSWSLLPVSDYTTACCATH